MGDILREWLIHQLGLEVHSPHPNNLCSKFQNGVFIGKLLQNYNVVDSKELSMLVDREDEEAKKSNFQHIKMWLNMINVPLDNDTIGGIMSGQRSVIYGFLYALCFHLESPNSLNLIKYAKQSYTALGSFDFSEVPSILAETTETDSSYEKLQQKFTINNASPISKKTNRSPSTLYDDVNKFERSLPVILNTWNARGDQSCIRRYLSDLKSRKQYAKLYECWRKETTRVYLQTNFDVSFCHNQEVLRNKSMPDKLIQMSECEELMLDKMNNTRFFIKKENSISIKNEIKFVKNYVHHERYDIVSDKIKLNMEKELIERNNYLFKVERIQIIKSIVWELVDFGVRIGSRRKTCCGNISKFFLDNSMEMFIKGRPLSNVLDNSLGLLLDPKYVEDNKPHSDDALITQSILNRRDILQYLKCLGNWSEQELGIKIDQNLPSAHRVLGFLVYDVFISIHALPASLVNMNNVILAPIMGVLDGEFEAASAREIFNALYKRNILPVLPKTAVQYCLFAYCQNTDAGELIQLLENVDSSIMINSSNKLSNEVMHDSLKKMSLNGVTQSKQTQTLEDIDIIYGLERIECGKNAFINIYNGKPLSKECLIDCVLCYIKQKNTYGGCVLVGFLQEEIKILEERLAQKHFPPYGSHSHMKNENLTILVPFKGPDLGDEGRYKSSFSSYLKILSSENRFDGNVNDDDMLKYYRSQNILTLLQLRVDENILWDNRKAELLCDVLTGQIVNWFEETDWVNCIYNTQQNDGKTISESFESGSNLPNTQEKEFKRERLHGKSEFDFIDHLSNIRSNMFSDSLKNLSTARPTKFEEINSNIFNMQLDSNDGVVLGSFWKSLERTYVDNMEHSMFHRRILISEQESFVISIRKYVTEVLDKSSMEKIELVNCLQSDLFNVPYDALQISDVTKQLSLTVSDVRNVLMQLINTKVEKCRQFIKNENIKTWLDTQMSSMIIIYKCMLQTEVDRVVNILIFINVYMSKLYKQKLPLSLISKKIEVPQTKNNWSKAPAQTITIVDDYFKKFQEIVNLATGKVKSIFSMTSEWLEETKETQNLNLSEKSIAYLKIWKYLIEIQNWSSVNQLKLLLARYHKDIEEMENFVTQCRSSMIQQINDRLRYEVTGVERICDLFVSAINERQYVRYKIIFVDDHFYLNSKNILHPDNPPPRPIPLLEPEDPCVINVYDLETMTSQLAAISPDGRISLVALSSWLMSYAKYFPRCGLQSWLKPVTPVLHTMFGVSVNYVDWIDFVINCLELPCPNADDLLELKHKYTILERAKRNNHDQNCVEGSIDKADFDSVSLWFQELLPLNPSVHLRYLKIKHLLFEIFSIDNKLDYVRMLLAFCKDDCSIVGFVKAICLVMDKNIMLDGQNDPNRVNEKHTVQLPMETLYKTLISCLKNYMAPDKSDLEDLTSLILNLHSHESECNSDVFTVSELFENDRLKLLTETGFRFNSRTLSIIMNNFYQP